MKKLNPDTVEAEVREAFPEDTHFVIFHAPIFRGWLSTRADNDEQAIRNLQAEGSGPCDVYRLVPDGRVKVFPRPTTETAEGDEDDQSDESDGAS